MTAGSAAPIRAAGAVLWRLAGELHGGAGGGRDGGPEIAVVHRPRYDDWSLPKGKLRVGELAPAAAVREVTEETGYSVVLGRRLGEARYEVALPTSAGAASKIVEYWAARTTGGSFMPNAEVDELRWLVPQQAAELLSYSWDRVVLGRFSATAAATTTTLLVRHAKAGNRDDWHGDDDLRPLTPSGRRQTSALRRFLPLFGPRRLYSAPPLRCVQTMCGLAEDLGTTLVEEPLLSESGYWVNPEVGVACALRLAEGDEPAVLCSQGGVIPDLVHHLAARSGLDIGDDVPSKKGSTWVLSLHKQSLVAADYYPPLT